MSLSDALDTIKSSLIVQDEFLEHWIKNLKGKNDSDIHEIIFTNVTQNLLNKSITVQYDISITLSKEQRHNYIDKLHADIMAYNVIIEHLRKLTTNVEAMRTAQKQYFNTRTHNALKKSVNLEKEVDAHIHYLLKSGLPTNQLNDEP